MSGAITCWAKSVVSSASGGSNSGRPLFASSHAPAVIHPSAFKPWTYRLPTACGSREPQKQVIAYSLSLPSSTRRSLIVPAVSLVVVNRNESLTSKSLVPSDMVKDTMLLFDVYGVPSVAFGCSLDTLPTTLNVPPSAAAAVHVTVQDSDKVSSPTVTSLITPLPLLAGSATGVVALNPFPIPLFHAAHVPPLSMLTHTPAASVPAYIISVVPLDSGCRARQFM